MQRFFKAIQEIHTLKPPVRARLSRLPVRVVPCLWDICYTHPLPYKVGCVCGLAPRSPAIIQPLHLVAGV
jgi:hypothetical protein